MLMTNFSYEIEVPFTENLGRRCVPACTAMILDTLMPGHGLDREAIEEMSGFTEGKATWAAQHLLSLSALGLEVGWIQDEDLSAFALDPDAFIARQIPNLDSLRQFKEVNDLELEASRIGNYLAQGLPFEQRQARIDDITSLATAGKLVRLEVNGKKLADEDGFTAHAVIISAFNDQYIRLENPDGLYGSKPKQVISWDELAAAWDEPILQHYSLPKS